MKREHRRRGLLWRALSLMLGAAIVASAACLPGFAAAANPYQPTEYVVYGGARFGRATQAYNYTSGSGESAVEVSVEGMPLFNGNVEDFDAYLGLLLEEMGDAGIIALASRGTATGSYVNAAGERVVYTIPGGNSTGGEALMGAAGQTELSTVMYQAQSWNKELINDIGYLIGSENKSKQDNGGYYWTSSTGTSMTDMRLNPLSGRYDEGYGEDSTMASIFADLNARGYNGYEGDESGFYIMASVNTKHYTVYNAQFFRPLASSQLGVRSFYEYNSKSANRGWTNGTFSSFMSSYGRINGVPSSASFITEWADSLGPYAVYTGTDAGADAPYLESEGSQVGQGMDYTYGEWSNGYDKAYSPNALYKAASMAIADHLASGSTETLQQAIVKGLNGVSVEDCLNAAIAYLTIRTRTGIYDERDANGLSKFYPYNDIAANASGKVDYTSASSQAVALRNAQEGIVLLKNEGNALPIGADDTVGVYGPFAQAVNSGIYAVAVQDYSGRGEEAGNSPLESIRLRDVEASYDMGLNQVTIQVGGRYLYVEAGDEDGIIQLCTQEEYDAAQDKTGFYFGILDNGQGATSIYAYGNGRWLRAILSDPTTNFNAYVGSTTPLANNAMIPVAPEGAPFGAGWNVTGKPLVVADEDCTFKQKPGVALPPMLSGYPYHFVLEDAGQEDTYYIRAGAKVNGVTFVAGVAALMDKYYGYYLEAGEHTPSTGEAAYETINLGGAQMGADSSTGAGLDYFENLADKSQLTFKLTEVEPYGYGAQQAAAEDDYAVIFVGQSYLGLSGEGTDRMTLELGESQVESALNIARTYKAQGKNTVVVVYANYPVIVEPLQQSTDVDAIVFAGYGGQYGGKATAQVLFGEYAPTGRLVSTWYKDMDLFPELNEYSIPQGAIGRTHDTMVFENGVALEDIDDGITVDMANADVIGTGLTYKYLTEEQTAAHVTYPFGYGLSYSNFAFHNLQAPAVASADEPFTVSVEVTNTGSVDTAEVVQIYMRKDGSDYGSAVAVKSLAGFEKVELAAGETKTVIVTIDPLDIALWDVNGEEFVPEPGAYTLWASDSSALSDANTLQTSITLEGQKLAQLDTLERVNVWEHSFDAQDTYYSEYSKLYTAAAAAADGVRDDIYAVGSRSAGAWTAIPKVELTGVERVVLNVASTGAEPSVELRLDSPGGELIGTVFFQPTGEVVRTLASNDLADAAEIHELGYVDAAAEIAPVSGVHDLYLVFTEKDTRVGTIQFQKNGAVQEQELSPGTVAIVQGKDGYEVVKKSAVQDGVLKVDLQEGSEYLVAENGQFFTDVPESGWIAEAAAFASSHELFQGIGNDRFGPNQSMTRAMLATVLHRLEDEPTGGADSRFDDIVPDIWYASAVNWAAQSGLVKGDGSLFRPDDSITREELATILYRYAQYLDMDVSAEDVTGGYEDAGSVSAWAQQAVNWAVDQGIILGRSEIQLAPQGTATRAEVATMLMRFVAMLVA